jgi:hypothetical protein
LSRISTSSRTDNCDFSRHVRTFIGERFTTSLPSKILGSSPTIAGRNLAGERRSVCALVSFA